MIPVTRLNHAVLYVRDADVAADFYQSAFGFEVVERIPGFATFLRAHGGENHHELGLFTVGADAQPIPDGPRVGLYHLAWEVPTIEALADARTHLQQLGALVGQSDHGASKSLYARDPDGNEFEVVWIVPREAWGEYANRGVVQTLDLDAELARFGVNARR
jgi:catechol-2,3-dioxygenase